MKKLMKKLPCEDCILIPVCRNRKFDITLRECSLLDNFIEENSIRRKPTYMRLIDIEVLNKINEIFKWGWKYEEKQPRDKMSM